MKTKFNGILTLLLALVVQISFAQERTISGTVSDASGPLPGVTVLKKGTTQGTETDFDGNYSIRVNTGETLVFSFVGMKTVERKVGAANQISVVLENDNLLEEVIVVGYGKTTKQSYTGTAKVVKAEQLEAKSVANISQALAGEVAGVNIINTSGQPGTAATIRIRGFGSVNGNRDPLYVVDGVPFSGSINSINPGDIATTTILKDATATAIYGSRGANGVILITTKSGKAGKTSMELDIKTGVNFQGLPRYDVINTPSEYIELAWHAMANRGLTDPVPTTDPVAYANANLFSRSGIDPTYNYFGTNDISQVIDPATGKVRPNVATKYTPENWGDYAFQTSIRTEANLKMSGGNDKTRYFSSFGYLDDKGFLINSGYKRYATRLNLTHKPQEWLTASANVGYSFGETLNNGQSENSGSIFWFVDNIPSIYPLFLRDSNGKMVADTKYGGNQYDYGFNRGFGGLTNAIAGSNYDHVGNERHSFNGNFSFKFQLMEGLEFETKYGAQYYNREANTVRNPFYGSAEGQGGSLYKTHSSQLTQNLLNIIRFNKSFGDHSISALAAHETNQNKYKISTISKNRVVNLNGGLTDLTNYVVNSSLPLGYTRKTVLESYFGQVSYDYMSKYYFSGSVRRDGSSRFARNKWGTFGSAGASWVISKESFMSNVNFVNFLKLKVSYGLLGDQAGVDTYSGRNAYDIGNLGGQISLQPRARTFDGLTWETSKMFQTGLEFTMFNNRLEGSFDYYVKNTKDLIFDKGIAPSGGNALLAVNDGALRNTGLEFDLTTHIIDKENYKFDVSVNGEIFNNELTRMPIDTPTGKEKILDIQGSYGRSNGHGLYDFYMREWAGVDPANGNPLWYQYYDDKNSNGAFDSGEDIKSLHEYQALNPNAKILRRTTSKYASGTQKYIGKSAIPKIRGAFRLNATIHDFTISALFGYSLGGYAYDGTYAGLMRNSQIGGNNWHTDIRNSWKKPGDVTDVPRLISNRNVQVHSRSSRFITSSDYLALNNVRIGYNLPRRFLGESGINGLNLWVSGDNLFLLSARDGFNPSTSETGASSTYRYSPLSTLTLGVRVNF